MATFQTPNGFVTWTEIVDEPRSPRIKFEVDRTTAVRTIDIDWANLLPMARAILGDSAVSYGPPQTTEQNAAGQGYAYIARNIPWAMPFFNRDGKKYLWASSVDAEGRGVPSDGNQLAVGAQGKDSIAVYNKARLTVEFNTRMYDIMSDADFIVASGGDVDEARLLRYVEKIYRPQGENLALTGNAYYYAGLGATPEKAKPLTSSINKIILSYNLALTWHFIPEEAVPSIFINSTAPNLAIDRCLGHVNRAPLHGCRPGTLLLMAAEIKPLVSALGNRIFDITYMFKFLNPSQTEKYGNVPGHNHIFRPFGADETPPTNGWFEAVASAILATSNTPTNFVAPPAVPRDGVNIYDFADFGTLFRPAAWRA